MPYKDYELHKKNARDNYHKNKEKKLAQAKAYYIANREKRDKQKLEWAKNNRDKVNSYMRKYYATEKGKNSLRKAYAKQLQKYPEKIAARQAVRNALRRGNIIKPESCSNCKVMDKIYAHHHAGYDLENQLNIIWLCKQCHWREHGKLV